MATRNWSESSVTNATPANTIDTEINNVRTDVRERMTIDHEWDSTDTGASDLVEIGQHTKITFAAPITSPTEDTDLGYVFTKDVVTGTNTTAEVHWLDESGNELQLTVEGAFNLGSNIPVDAIDQDDIRLENNSYLTARNAADDGDVNVVKVNGTDGVEFADAVKVNGKITNVTDPTTDQDAATKASVDAAIATACTFTPSSYSGGESVTLPNGFIIKCGKVVDTGTGSVTFGDAFPNAIISVSITNEGGEDASGPGIDGESTTGFDWGVGSGNNGFFWQAYGY